MWLQDRARKKTQLCCHPASMGYGGCHRGANGLPATVENGDCVTLQQKEGKKEPGNLPLNDLSCSNNWVFFFQG